MTIEPLGPQHLLPLKKCLTQDAPHNLYLLSLLEEYGLSPTAHATFYGRLVHEALTAALFVAASKGLAVPSTGCAAYFEDIAKALMGTFTLQSCLGEKASVDTLCRYFPMKAASSRFYKLFYVSADDLGPFTNPLLRLATEADFKQLLPMAAACEKELYKRDFMAENPSGFSAQVLHKVRTGCTYVLEGKRQQLVLKLDVGSRSPHGALLERVYTLPEERRRGHATLSLGQISRFLLSSRPLLSMLVDASNTTLSNILRRVGYQPGRLQRLVGGVS